MDLFYEFRFRLNGCGFGLGLGLIYSRFPARFLAVAAKNTRLVQDAVLGVIL
jgi:hypothetical protein